MRIPKHPSLVLLACLLATGGSGVSRAETILHEKEIVSREMSLFIGGREVAYPSVVSRECSLFIHSGPIHGNRLMDTREISLVVTTPEVPDPVTQLVVDVSPTGESVSLDWTDYNELLQNDLVEYRIYISTSPFTNVGGMEPYATNSVGNTFFKISGLPAWTDHYFAVVAVDALGGYNPVVEYSAAYVLSPRLASREYSIAIGAAKEEPQRSVLSRDFSLVVTTPEAPAAITDFAVQVSPTGDSALLDWSSYNELLQKDVARYDIYYSSSPFTNVAERTPYATVNAETLSLLLTGLAQWTDHYFAIVPVDAMDNFDPIVAYGAAYALTPEIVSREFSISIGSAPVGEGERRTCSREATFIIADNTVPAPVTGVTNDFSVVQSIHDYQSVDIDWMGYDELLQRDVVRYRVYVAPAFFDDVSGMEPFTYVPAGTRFLTLSGLDAFGVYHVAVVAEDSQGNFNPSVRSESGQASTAGVGEVMNLQVVCGETSLLFSWDPPPEDVGTFLESYNIYFAGATDPEILPPTSTTFAVTNLLVAHGYPFRITTTDIFDTETAGVSLLAATLLDNPTNVVAQGLDTQVSLTWDDVSPLEILDHYAVYQSGSPFTNVAGLVPVNTTVDHGLVVGGLVNFSNYHFAVVAVNVAGCHRTNVQSVAAMPEPDTIAPEVVGFIPDDPFRIDDANVEQLFSGFTLTFSEPVDDASFTTGDIAVTNASGAVLVEALTRLAPSEYHVRLHEAYAAGSNTVAIGTNILDLAGNPMTARFETVVMLTNPALAPGSGDGLLGTYYDGTAFQGTSYPRIDAQVDFDWHANAPIPEIGTDYCSIRWTGQIEPRYDGDYVFTLVANDGVRLWIGGALVIDDWSLGDGERSSTNVYLTNEQRYDIVLEYFEQTLDANIQLQWQFATLPKEVVPQSQLYTGLVSSNFVATPVMVPPAGVYYGITDVTLSSATTNAQIYYTLGDSDPYGDWTLYDGSAIRLISNATIRAIAIKAGLNDSGVRVADYDISLVPVPDYDWWKTVNFLGITNEAIIGKAADPDLDGIPNIIEYAYCLDPNNAADERRIWLEPGDAIDHWMVGFDMPTNQSAGSFCWSSNLIDWIDVVVEKTNITWFARSNRCAVVSQNASAYQPDELVVDTLLLGDDPIFFRFDRATEPLAVTGRHDMVVYPQDRLQEWYANFLLRAEDPTIEQFLEVRENLMSGDWLPPVAFSYSNHVWSVDNADWSISSQTEEIYTEWLLRVRLPQWPVDAPVYLRYSVRDFSK